MQTKEQIEQAFREELQALLDKYGAELEAKDHWQGYAECGEDVRIDGGRQPVGSPVDCHVRAHGAEAR